MNSWKLFQFVYEMVKLTYPSGPCDFSQSNENIGCQTDVSVDRLSIHHSYVVLQTLRCILYCIRYVLLLWNVEFSISVQVSKVLMAWWLWLWVKVTSKISNWSCKERERRIKRSLKGWKWNRLNAHFNEQGPPLKANSFPKCPWLTLYYFCPWTCQFVGLIRWSETNHLGSSHLLLEWGSGIGAWGLCLLVKRVLTFFPLEMGCWSFFCSFKFPNFLKDVILYVKQLKFVVLTHSKGALKVCCWQGGWVKVFCMLLGVLKVLHYILTPNPWPPLMVINEYSLSAQ